MAAPALSPSSRQVVVWHAGDESEVPLPTSIPLHDGMTWREVRFDFASKINAPVPSVTLFFPGNTPIPLDQPASDDVRVDATLRACTANSILLAYDFIDVFCTTALSFFSEPTLPNLRLRQTQALVASGVATSAHHYLRRLVRREGWAALYRGIVVKVIPRAVSSLAKDLFADAFASPAPSYAIAMLASELASLPLNRLLGTPLAPPPAAPRGVLREVFYWPAIQDLRLSFAALVPALPFLITANLTAGVDPVTNKLALASYVPVFRYLVVHPARGLAPTLAASVVTSLITAPIAFAGRYVLFSLPQRSPSQSLRDIQDRGLLFTFLLQDIAFDLWDQLLSYMARVRPHRLRAAFTAPHADDTQTAVWLLGGAVMRLLLGAAGGVALWRWTRAADSVE